MYDTLKTNLAAYNKILKANIKAAKALYFHEMFLKYKKDIKKTIMRKQYHSTEKKRKTNLESNHKNIHNIKNNIKINEEQPQSKTRYR